MSSVATHEKESDPDPMMQYTHNLSKLLVRQRQKQRQRVVVI